MVDRALLETLRQWDTPTICNALELVAPELRTVGFSTRPFVVADPRLPPIVGRARTGLLRAAAPPRGAVPTREAWYDYAAGGDIPTIVVIQDGDDPPGFGAFWGEVHTAVHLALGVIGCVTNGSFRDLDVLAPGFQILGGSIGPSHAWNHIAAFGGDVTVHGLTVGHDDLMHADRHGAVVIPEAAAAALPAAIDLLVRREKIILDASRQAGFSAAVMRDALREAGDIH